MPDGLPAKRAHRAPHMVMSTPVGAGGGRSAPTGVDRQGRGRSSLPDLPRDEVRFSSRRLGRNPPSGSQSLGKTSESSRMVALSYKNLGKFTLRLRRPPTSLV